MANAECQMPNDKGMGHLGDILGAFLGHFGGVAGR